MVQSRPTTAGPAQQELLRPLVGLAEEGGRLSGGLAGSFVCDAKPYVVPRFVFAGPPAEHDPIRLGLFAGVHGDEPAGCAALVNFLVGLAAEPERAYGYHLVVFPVCNPTGYEDGTRHNRAGVDLNREFWRNSIHPEVRLLEAELARHRFDGIITLHADDTSEGHYGYTHGRELNAALLEPALCAAERVLPRDRRALIDGFAAREGAICDCYQGVLSAPPLQRPQPFDVIFETPARAPFALQVDAGVAALDAILGAYRGFIAYSQNL
jgi:hypothetical protein